MCYINYQASVLTTVDKSLLTCVCPGANSESCRILLKGAKPHDVILIEEDCFQTWSESVGLVQTHTHLQRVFKTSPVADGSPVCLLAMFHFSFALPVTWTQGRGEKALGRCC